MSPAGNRVVVARSVVRSFARVSYHLRRRELPEVVAMLGTGPPPRWNRPPVALGRTVVRALTRLPGYDPRCLVRTLVTYDLAQRMGHPVEVVIGLPAQADGTDAHAWLELHGRDLGPPPGRDGHLALVRYP